MLAVVIDWLARYTFTFAGFVDVIWYCIYPIPNVVCAISTFAHKRVQINVKIFFISIYFKFVSKFGYKNIRKFSIKQKYFGSYLVLFALRFVIPWFALRYKQQSFAISDKNKKVAGVNLRLWKLGMRIVVIRILEFLRWFYVSKSCFRCLQALIPTLPALLHRLRLRIRRLQSALASLWL